MKLDCLKGSIEFLKDRISLLIKRIDTNQITRKQIMVELKYLLNRVTIIDSNVDYLTIQFLKFMIGDDDESNI